MRKKAKREHCLICGKRIEEVHISPYFCAPCDAKRIARINKALAPVAKALGYTDWPES